MGIFNEVMLELQLTEDQLKDNQIYNFALQYSRRKNIGDWIQYKNGNAIIEINKNDGTSIRTILSDEEYQPEFPENIDMNISNKCENNCSFCYQKCTKKGKEANIIKYLTLKDSFLWTLQPGTELALNGNEPLHKDLIHLLRFCKTRNILANLTVNEITLLKHKRKVEKYLKDGYIHGIGISPMNFSDEMIQFCTKHNTAVIHTIAGITTMDQYQKLMDKNLKILILGYKDFGRGIDYASKHNDRIEKLIVQLSNEIKDFPKHFNVVSFDNLAIQQLDPKSFLTEKQWETFYRGGDGRHTLFVDLVNETFAKNSIQCKENHRPLLSDIRDMLKVIRES